MTKLRVYTYISCTINYHPLDIPTLFTSSFAQHGP